MSDNNQESPLKWLADERDIKLAAIRKWIIAEHDQMSYFDIVTGIRAVLDWSLASQDRDNEALRLYAQSHLRTESETTKPQELDLRSCMCPKYLEQIQALTQANECLKEYIRGFEAASDIVCQERDGYRISLAQLEQQIKEFAGVKDEQSE